MGSFLLGDAAAVDFDVRAKTQDKISATVFVPNVGRRVGNARQGSFGAPSINDKGTVAYACILSGTGISATTNNSVVTRLKGKQPARVAVQAGNSLVDGFVAPIPDGSYPVSGSANFYRISREVTVNNKNRVAFTAQILYTYATDSGEAPDITTAFTNTETAVYGILLPNNKKASSFTCQPLVTFLSYYDGILEETLSLNSQSSVVFDANFFITDTKSVPGFAFSSPTDGGIIATTESPVIGLPYFTTFQSFSEPIIADKNVAFVVADISDDGDDFDGIWQGNNPDLQPVVVKNTAAPSGGQFLTFGEKIGPSRNSNVCAFTATVSGATGGGVYRAEKTGKNSIRIAALGENAPDNAQSGSLGSFTQFGLAASNNAGQVAFLGSVPGKSSGTRSGIWLSDKDGDNVQLIVVEGQSLTIGSTAKTVTKLAFSPISGLNKLGQVAFTASFTDRTSAVIIAKL